MPKSEYWCQAAEGERREQGSEGAGCCLLQCPTQQSQVPKGTARAAGRGCPICLRIHPMSGVPNAGYACQSRAALMTPAPQGRRCPSSALDRCARRAAPGNGVSGSPGLQQHRGGLSARASPSPSAEVPVELRGKGQVLSGCHARALPEQQDRACYAAPSRSARSRPFPKGTQHYQADEGSRGGKMLKLF